MKIMYKVVTVNEFGLTVTQQDGFNNSEEAQQEAEECIERWGEMYGQDFWVEPYEYKYKKERQYNNNAVDGWEDLYPLEE